MSRIWVYNFNLGILAGLQIVYWAIIEFNLETFKEELGVFLIYVSQGMQN